jgi:hypothetical protein
MGRDKAQKAQKGTQAWFTAKYPKHAKNRPAFAEVPLAAGKLISTG